MLMNDIIMYGSLWAAIEEEKKEKPKSGGFNAPVPGEITMEL